MLQYSQIPEFLKTVARGTLGRNIPWKMREFFRTKNGFKKCILSQVELIRHWNNKRNTFLNFKLELTERIRNRNSIFVDLIYKSAYWLKLCIKFYDSEKRKQRYKKCRIVYQYKVYRELIRNTYSKHCFLWVSNSGFIE